MPASKRFLHPEAIGRIARLDLRARHIVEGFLSGIHRSPYFGQSVEFLQHREYTRRRRSAPRRLESLGQAGPLLRQAVRGRHEPALHAAGRRLGQHADTARARSNKYEYGCTIAACLAYLLLRQQDAVGCVAFDEAIRAKVPQRTKRSHLNSIMQALAVSEPRDKTDLAIDPARRGRSLSAARHDGADLRSAGRAGRTCSRASSCCGSKGTT